MPPSGARPPRPKLSLSSEGSGRARPAGFPRSLLDPDSTRFQVAITSVAIALTFAATALFVADLARGVRWSDPGAVASLAPFGVAVLLLVYGGLVYQFARLGYMLRKARYRPADDQALDSLRDRDDAPSVTVLVPSYKESPTTIRQTLLSAALQDYPSKNVVLLIDDQPDPADPADAALLAAARQIPRAIQETLDEARDEFEGLLRRMRSRHFDETAEQYRVADAYERAASWFDARARDTTVHDHTDLLFVRIVYLEQARSLRRAGARFARLASITSADAERAYLRLIRRFDVEVMSFERKRFVNLSHEPNKAMNLNTYLSLLGRSLKTEQHDDGAYLFDTSEDDADISVRRPDMVVTLDADSMLTHEYVLRLVEILDRPGNERLAVAQSPYRAIPASPIAAERVAGATTDIMYVWQQGSTFYNAAYWVGANAVLRTDALEQIATTHTERGFSITKFIQDHTLIEDTESTVDVIRGGWRIYNYPARLAYSATPPDFGSLIIQRRRWANGGLLIMPKLIRYLLAPAQRRLSAVPEAFMRIHYLLAEAGVNSSIVAVFLIPLWTGAFSYWIPLTAAPYFALYTLDLKREGYTWPDMLRVYALNLVMIPVNLAGMLNSVRQGLTGKKVPFGRTPKVAGRTIAPAVYVAIEYLLVGVLMAGGAYSLIKGHPLHAGFSLANGLFLLYGILAFIGLRESWEDLRGLRPPAHVPSSSHAAVRTHERAAAGHRYRHPRPDPRPAPRDRDREPRLPTVNRGHGPHRD